MTTSPETPKLPAGVVAALDENARTAAMDAVYLHSDCPANWLVAANLAETAIRAYLDALSAQPARDVSLSHEQMVGELKAWQNLLAANHYQEKVDLLQKVIVCLEAAPPTSVPDEREIATWELDHARHNVRVKLDEAEHGPVTVSAGWLKGLSNFLASISVPDEREAAVAEAVNEETRACVRILERNSSIKALDILRARARAGKAAPDAGRAG